MIEALHAQTTHTHIGATLINTSLLIQNGGQYENTTFYGCWILLAVYHNYRKVSEVMLALQLDNLSYFVSYSHLKISGASNGIPTHDLCNTGTMVHQLS